MTFCFYEMMTISTFIIIQLGKPKVFNTVELHLKTTPELRITQRLDNFAVDQTYKLTLLLCQLTPQQTLYDHFSDA